MSSLDQIAANIIKEQELIIGPMAWSEAGKVAGLKVDRASAKAECTDADPKSAIDHLVAQYEHLFGRASREVSKEAAAGLISGLSPSEIPSSLQA